MGVLSFPVVSGAQVTSVFTAAQGGATKMEPGTIMAVRTQTDQYGLVQWVQLDNNGCSQGEALICNFATLKQYSVKQAAVTDGGAPLGGIAAATIASQSFGFMYIHGYVEKVDFSKTIASGEYFALSASTAGKLTSIRASVFNAGTQGSSSAFIVCGVARTAIATGVGSATLLGVWGV